jgi:PAT family acetyl-CoA transporter-like MFS transporter 1
MVAYPYFFKIIFSPLVDLFHFKELGRRKRYFVLLFSYILPCMFGMSIFVFWQSSIELKDNYHLFCLLGFLNATLLGISDIAVDGLATDLCK